MSNLEQVIATVDDVGLLHRIHDAIWTRLKQLLLQTTTTPGPTTSMVRSSVHHQPPLYQSLAASLVTQPSAVDSYLRPSPASHVQTIAKYLRNFNLAQGECKAEDARQLFYYVARHWCAYTQAR